MRGQEFIDRYSGIFDSIMIVELFRTYKIRTPTVHFVYEHYRVRTFRQLLLEPSCEENWTILGELMYQSHDSYSACGLNSCGTDLIVDLVRLEGIAYGLYGVRISGGGS